MDSIREKCCALVTCGDGSRRQDLHLQHPPARQDTESGQADSARPEWRDGLDALVQARLKRSIPPMRQPNAMGKHLNFTQKILAPVAILGLLAFTPFLNVAYATNNEVWDFLDPQPLLHNLTGDLQGGVKFAQTHTIDAAGNAAKEMPSLVTDREALLMFIPSDGASAVKGLQVTATQGGQVLGTLAMQPPSRFPRSDTTNVDGRPSVQYTTRAWSVRVPWNWMHHGLSLRFQSPDGRQAVLASEQIDFSGASELVLQNIRIGMLTDPPPASGNYLEQHTAEMAVDYFQKIPISRLVVGQYRPVKLARIVMPDGTSYLSSSKSNGGIYEGDMRERIGKALIATGINRANYGLPDSAGSSQNQPGYFMQVVAHQNIGMYANGRQQHGLSGGNGMATLTSVTGNQFSHELGHNFGLQDYFGGGRYGSHNLNSGWGYDGFRHRMIGNVAWSAPPADNDVKGVKTAPFKGHYKFNSDAMAGGYPDSTISQLTHHTGYSAYHIQKNLVNYPVPDKLSPTGYRQWDANTKTMSIHTSDSPRPTPTAIGVPVVTLVGFYDPLGMLESSIYPALYGNYGNTYAPQANQQCRLHVKNRKGNDLSFGLTASRSDGKEMNKFHVNIAASLQPSTATVMCNIGNTERTLHTVQIDAPPDFSAPVIIGKSDGYRAYTSSLPILKESGLSKKRYASEKELGAALEVIYGPVRQWISTEQGKAGTTYWHRNRSNGYLEYFMLQIDGHYPYFPVGGSSNREWRYLGRAEDFI